MRSACCRGFVRVAAVSYDVTMGADALVTHYHRCCTCGRPCDPLPEPKTAGTATPEEAPDA